MSSAASRDVVLVRAARVSAMSILCASRTTTGISCDDVGGFAASARGGNHDGSRGRHETAREPSIGWMARSWGLCWAERL